ncbi:MAG: molecular chaperone DnaJ [bacterium]|nr:molecular chaperone DnaJ [bacterium]
MAKDYYKILGVPRNASKEDVKHAYRKLAHLHHPDKAGGNEAKFKEINEAYQVLGDEKKRSQYDQFGRVFEGGGGSPFGQGGFSFGEEFRGFGDFDFSDIFEDVLGGMGFAGGKREPHSKKGRDIQIDLEIPFEEMIFGGKHEVSLQKLGKCERCGGTGAEAGSKMVTCNTCHGSGKVEKIQRTILGVFSQVSICSTCNGKGEVPEVTCKNCGGRGVLRAEDRIEIFVPAGVNGNELLKVSGKGEASVTGGVPGDLFVKIHVMSSKIYKRQSNDVIMMLSVKFTDAALGAKVDLGTPDGKIVMKIPEGTESGDILKVRGKGVPHLSGYGRGDLLIEIKVETPKKLSRKAKEMIEKLKEEGV